MFGQPEGDMHTGRKYFGVINGNTGTGTGTGAVSLRTRVLVINRVGEFIVKMDKRTLDKLDSLECLLQ